MNNIIIHLQWPPTVNSYYSCTKRGIYISKKGRLYRDAVEESVHEQVGRLVLGEQLHMRCVLYPPDRRRRDLDNYMKAMLDALTHAEVWEDDSQIDQLEIYRGEVQSGGAVIIEINESGPVLPYQPAVMDLI